MGWAGVPTGAGLVDGEVDQDLIPGEGVREGLAGWVRTGAGVVDGGTGGQGGGARARRGGCKGFGSGGVGGRDTGPRDGANFATCVAFLSFQTKEEKWRFLKDALRGGGGYPPELAWWTGR